MEAVGTNNVCTRFIEKPRNKGSNRDYKELQKNLLYYFIVNILIQISLPLFSSHSLVHFLFPYCHHFPLYFLPCLYFCLLQIPVFGP